MPSPDRDRSRVDIHYRRLPDDVQVFTQDLVLDRSDVKVTLARNLAFDSPVVIRDQIALEPGSDAVWFTFPGRWHDIGRFHRKDDTFTGIYANILTPPTFVPPGDDRNAGRGGKNGDSGATSPDAHRPEEGAKNPIWETTDLFLDVWLPKEGGFFVLDRDQLAEAEGKGWIDPHDAERARREVERIESEHEAGRWPPAVVAEWTLERARAVAG